MFCFGDEAEAKSAAALAASLRQEQDKDTSSIDQQAVQASSQEQVQPGEVEAHLTKHESSPEEGMADSGSGSLQQPVLASASTSGAEQAETSESVGAPGNSSSTADTSDGEASGSERLADMTPQQLEGLKVILLLHVSECREIAFTWHPHSDKA